MPIGSPSDVKKGKVPNLQKYPDEREINRITKLKIQNLEFEKNFPRKKSWKKLNGKIGMKS